MIFRIRGRLRPCALFACGLWLSVTGFSIAPSATRSTSKAALTSQTVAPAESQASPIQSARITSFDRDAFTFSSYRLTVTIDPAAHMLSVSGEIAVTNDSEHPQTEIAMQISSQLKWTQIQVGGASARFVSSRLKSDIDHTGAVNEAVVQLPNPVAPTGEVTITVAYSGAILPDATRLTALGTPAKIAANSDWDEVSSTFTAVRGLGNVVWYPVSIPPVMLGDGNELFTEIARWNGRHATTRWETRFKMTAADAKGRESGPHDLQPAEFVALGAASGPCAHDCYYSGVASLADRTPFFALTAGYQHLSPGPPDDRAQVFFRPESAVLARRYLDILGQELASLAAFKEEPAAYISRKAKREKDRSFRPLSDAVRPTIFQLPHGYAAFDGGRVLFTPLRDASDDELERTLVHTAAHATFMSERAWMDEGFAAFAQALEVEHRAGRAAALDFMGQSRGALAIAESIQPEDSAHRPSLITTGDDIFFRTKATYVWWMLRDMVGEKPFQQAVADYPFHPDTGPAYFEQLLEKSTGHNLDWFFNDWVYADKGLPEFHIVNVYSRRILQGGYLSAVTVENTGDAGAEVPIVVHTEAGDIVTRLELMAHDKATARIETNLAPSQVTVNDGSVPETDPSDNTFIVEAPKK